MQTLRSSKCSRHDHNCVHGGARQHHAVAVASTTSSCRRSFYLQCAGNAVIEFVALRMPRGDYCCGSIGGTMRCNRYRRWYHARMRARVYIETLCVSSYAINFRSSRKNFARRNEHRGKSDFKAQRAKLKLGVLSAHALGIFDVKFALSDPNGNTSVAGSWLQQ